MAPRSLGILRVVQSTYPEVVGGVGIHVHDMSRHQANMGHDVTVLTSDNGDRSLPAEERRSGYTVVRHRELARPMDNSITPGLARSAYDRASRADVIHTHSHLYFSSNVAAAVSRLSETPLVITNHGLFSQTAPMSVQKAYLETLGGFTFNAAKRVFCYTDRAKRLLRDHGVSTPAAVVHNGIDCDRFSPSGTTRRNQILFVGRFKPGKRPAALIDAFAAVAPEYPEYHLTLAGDGPMKETLVSRCVDAGIRDRVTFAGEVAYDDMPELYDESEFLVVPTKTEAAIPRVVMEAWACETPVVMADIQEVDEDEVAEGGLVCDGSPAGLRTSMRRLIEDPALRQRLGARGQELVRDRYSWQETVEATTEEYYEVIHE